MKVLVLIIGLKIAKLEQLKAKRQGHGKYLMNKKNE